jgi:glycosyltransferase involved in cell wall biosynthesis
VGTIRVLHLIASNFVGGPEKQILTHLRYVERSRYRLLVGSFIEAGKPNALLEAAHAQEVPVLPLRQRFLLDLSVVRQLRRRLIADSIDVLVTHGYKANIVGHWARAGLALAQGMYVRGWTAENLKVKLYNRLERPYLRKASRVVTVAAGKRAELERLGVRRDQIRVVVNAVEPLELEKPILSLRERFAIAPDRLLLLAAGRLSPEKGHRDLLQALVLLKRDGPSIACVLFGDGPLAEHLARARVSLGLERELLLAGFDTDWKNHLPEADALVNPSLSEVMPNVVLESMAQGCPVIATDVGGVSELIEDGVTGLLVPSADPQSLAAAIRSLRSDRDRALTRANNARRRVRARYSFAQQALHLEELYDELYALGRLDDTRGSGIRGRD